MVSRVVSGAHYGLRDWLVQRFSAVIMLAYSVTLIAYVAMHQPLHYATWHALFSHASMRYFTLLFALSLYLHAWVGVRDILMDYVRLTWVRLSLQVATIVVLVLYGMWIVTILWSVK
jgi:succinate dehydrogenase / fumarate reductase membrane anchor subunit